MRKFTSLLVLNLIFGGAACELSTGEDDAEQDGGTASGTGNGDGGGRGTAVNPNNPAGSTTNDAGSATIVDAQVSPDAGTTTPSDAATSPPVTTTSPEQCIQTLATASNACGAADTFEPNDAKEAALAIDTSSGCGMVPAKLSSHADDDWYLFSSPKSDPVRIELAYETTATGGAKLAYRLYEATSGGSIQQQDGREDIKWTLSSTYVVKKNIAYQVDVYDQGTLQGCQGYNLRIDPLFCTDPYEDNDVRTAPSALASNTTLAATAFNQDEDWYDVTSFQAQGARCTITAEIAPTSSQRLTVRTYGPGSTGSLQQADMDANSASATLTLAAGSTSLLDVYASLAVCTKYTVVCKPL